MIIPILTTILLGAAIIGPVMSNVEHPNYQVVSSAEHIEVRQYAPMIIAEVEVKGERKQAIGDGFRILADYIFGNNTVGQDIAMTAPVQQQNNQEIAMAAPVQQQSAGNAWKVSFIMPEKYNIDSLPKPNDNRVKLQEIPSKKFAVIQFSGTNSNHNIAEHEQQLKQYINEHQLQATGSSKYAFYNPPWTVPFMRRNEVMIEIK